MHTLKKKKKSLSVKAQRKTVHHFLGHHSWVTLETGGALKSERVVRAAEEEAGARQQNR